MKKTYLFGALTVVMTVVLLLGLGSPAPVPVNMPWGAAEKEDEVLQEPPLASPVELNITLSVSPAEFRLFERITDGFEERNPHVHVQMENIPEQKLYAHYLKDTSLGTAPDVMLMKAAWVRSFASEGRLRALDDVVAVEQQNRWFDSVLETVSWNGYIWALPANWNPYVIVYKPPAATGGGPAGKPAPSTVTEWLDRYGEPALNRSDYESWTVISDGLVVPDQRPSEVGATDEAGQQSSDEAKRLTAAWNDGAQEASEALEKVLRGEAAWAIVTLSEALQFSGERNVKDGSLMLTPVPPPAARVNRTVPPLTGLSFGVSPVSLHPEEAANWITYVSDRILQEEAAGNELGPVGFSVSVNAYPFPSDTLNTPAAEAGEAVFPLGILPVSELGKLMEAVDAVHAADEPAADSRRTSVVP
ncbi:ABC transporter substrate-binding protein [Paenibacillus alkalitolerans]|uniref:ABC transporter substrate-binding protein n=1 Tax=Paenibacillus alkalitolerans TaxID=2799335 RepID=UPI0018F45DB9|nr:extracellular solute-binding protein [Paenibacillus alkalitolerans]